MSDADSSDSTGRRFLRADVSPLLVAIIWGSGFVAQRLGMEQLGPFSFNAARSAIGE